MRLEDIQTIYFVGIGGIGMSAIARYFNDLGAAVHGYDRTETYQNVGKRRHDHTL